MNKILLVGRSGSEQSKLQSVLVANGYEVLIAENGTEAYRLFLTEALELVIIQMEQAQASCVGLVEKIKSVPLEDDDAGIPVLILAKDTASEALLQMLAVGAEDFLQLPYSSEQLFLAKVASLMKLKTLVSDLRQSKQCISILHSNLALEHEAAERIFDRFVHRTSKAIPGLETHISSASIFNGDVFLSGITPSGNVMILLGDFTGHGLPAAIGAIPMAEVFYSMSKKGRTPCEILSVMNAKLKDILPVHVFFSCVMVQIQPDRKMAAIFNAGMQPVIQLNSVTREVQLHHSISLPLGILTSEELNFNPVKVTISEEDKFILYTDGLVESMNEEKEMFGVQRVVEMVQNDPEMPLVRLSQAAKVFCNATEFDDDVSIAKLRLREILALSNDNLMAASNRMIVAASAWRLRFEFSHENIQSNQNPIEGVVDAIMAMQPLVEFKEELFVVISELYHNAVEHGLLELDSMIKNEENGFMLFTQLKQQRLQAMTEGNVVIELEQIPQGEHAADILVHVSHSGVPNYDIKLNETIESTQFSGRGLFLITRLCETLTFNEGATAATARYRWQQVTA
ncbi:MAG: fused response regulator/phosphatase [Hydrogenovibrio sp.]|nr:fused response regulator/phosphatase [Hydrogenovibrio sp.]